MSGTTTHRSWHFWISQAKDPGKHKCCKKTSETVEITHSGQGNSRSTIIHFQTESSLRKQCPWARESPWEENTLSQLISRPSSLEFHSRRSSKKTSRTNWERYLRRDTTPSRQVYQTLPSRILSAYTLHFKDTNGRWAKIASKAKRLRLWKTLMYYWVSYHRGIWLRCLFSEEYKRFLNARAPTQFAHHNPGHTFSSQPQFKMDLSSSS